MRFDRTKNAKRILFSGLVIKVFSMIIPFVMRTIIIYSLGTVYLGLSSLFTSILNALNLAELGVGSAMVFSMYKPVANDDKKTINALLMLYKRTYYVIGCIVLMAGIIILPFLKNFINGEYPNEINLYLIFFMYLVSTVSGYFFMAYKSSILIAYQRSDIIYKVTLITEIVMYSVQAFSLVVLKNYYIYVMSSVIRIIVQNLVVATIVDRKHPEIKAEGNLEKDVKRDIFKKTGALMGHKIASVVINSIDNVFISMFISLEMVAIYNNYFYILTALSGILLLLINGLQSVVGNYLIDKEKKASEKMFYTLHYIVAFIICYCCSCLMTLYQPFIQLWVGSNMLLPIISVAFFVFDFLVIKLRSVNNLFIDAAGLWEKNILCSYLIIVIDLVLDIWLLRTIGINGAIISSIVSMFFSYVYDSIILFKYYFKSRPHRHLFNSLIYLLVISIICGISFLCCNSLPLQNTIVLFICSFFISSVIAIISFWILTRWMFPYKDACSFIKTHFFKRLKKTQ